MGIKGSWSRVEDHEAYRNSPLWDKKPNIPKKRQIFDWAVTDRDWVEDFEHENGQYFCQCFECDEQFMGHKRRYVCKVCHTKAKEAFEALSEEEQKAVMEKKVEDAKEFFEKMDGFKPRANHTSTCPFILTEGKKDCECEGGDWVIGRRGARQLGTYDG